MANSKLVYDILAGKDLLSPALRKLADQSKKLNDKFGKFAKKGKGDLKGMKTSAGQLGDKLGGISAKFKGALNRMTANFKAWKIRNANTLSELFSNIKLPSFVGKLGNPFALAVGSTTGIVAGLGAASEAAAQFSSQFRGIANINQDKTAAELAALKNQLSTFSFTQAVAPTEAITGYYDLQSATGAYGAEAFAVMSKVDKFSKATQGNFIDNINATAKAMVQFGFGSNKVDEYLASNAKTVKLGITTFEQLGRVQTEYLGAALNAGQGFEQANKLFAAMTSVSKNTDIAATLTKGAFEGLADPRITKALQKQGVGVFDNTGKMLKLEQVTNNLRKKMLGMTDMEFQAFAGELGGNEGFKAFLSKVKNAGGKLDDMFAKFSNTKFDLEAAVKLATDDPLEVRKRIAAKFKGLTTKIGLKLNLQGVQLWVLTKVEQGLDLIYRLGMFISQLRIGDRIGEGITLIKDKITDLSNTIYGYFNSAYTLFKQNWDIIKPILIGVGLALITLNAQAIFAAITAIPSLALSLVGLVSRFILLTGFTLAYNGILIIGKGLMLGVAAAARIFAIAQWAVNAALTANPIGLIIVGIIALVTGLYVAYQRSLKFRAAIAGIGGVINNALPIFFGFGKIIEGIFDGNFSTIKEGFNDVIEGFKNFNPLKAFRTAVYAKVETEVSEKRAKEKADKEAGVDGKTEVSLAGDVSGLLGGFEMPFKMPSLPEGLKLPELPELPKVPTTTAATPVNSTNPNNGLPTIPNTTGGGLNFNQDSTGGLSPDRAAAVGTKNINVTIGKLVETVTITANEAVEGIEDLSEVIAEKMVEAVRKAEIELSF